MPSVQGGWSMFLKQSSIWKQLCHTNAPYLRDNALKGAVSDSSCYQNQVSGMAVQFLAYLRVSSLCIKEGRLLLWTLAAKQLPGKEDIDHPSIHPSIYWYDQQELPGNHASVLFPPPHPKPAAVQHISHQHRLDWHWHRHLKGESLKEWFWNLGLESSRFLDSSREHGYNFRKSAAAFYFI